MAEISDDIQAAEQRAVHLLSRREHSATELKRKLEQKGFASDVTEEVLQTLQQRGWQDDARFVESFIRQRIQSGYGPLKIRFDLQQKGIAAAASEAALAQTEVDWVELAAERYRRRFGTEPADDNKERAKRQRHLYQRGFLPDQVRRACELVEGSG